MQQTQKGRLIELINTLELTQSRFEDATGMSRGSISHLNGEPTARMLHKIGAAFPEVNINWIITGNGKKFLVDNKVLTNK